MEITAVIIDDEFKARNVLQNILQENFPEVKILAQADDVPEGVLAIRKHQPQLVFLDIEMPGYNGFQLLDFFGNINFNIIFTTAYSEYALQAFQVSAIDYLLKPIQIEKLKNALEKFKNGPIPQQDERIDTLKQNLNHTGIQKLALPVASGLRFIKVDDIVYLKADGSYTNFVLENEKLLISKKLKDFEDLLAGNPNFYRPHRSYLINIHKVKEFNKGDGGYIIMDNNDEVGVSRELKEETLKKLGVQ